MADIVLTGNAVYKPKVLLAEDDPLLQNMYRTKFKNEGFDVLTASDGQQAVDIALSSSPSCIVMDIMMPILSGIDALEKIRQDPQGKDIPVIMFTNLTISDNIKRAQELGVAEFLIKTNVTPKEVVEKVRMMLEKPH